MSDLTNIIKESFSQYAGAVIQSRALVDVRDGLKPSARQIFYALYTDKFLPTKPYRKTLKAVGSLSRFYIHGDTSAVGILMRAGQPFAMRYPLMDIHGNGGTLMESGNWAHQRYTESRLSKMGANLFEDIDKDTIAEWRDNYDDSEQYPSILPSKGFYNICNGTSGIAVGAASSIPQYNLKEMNEKLIYLLNNPNCSFEDIYIAPDFATGGVLYNESEVKDSMKCGTGFACKLRSVVDFDPKERCLVVTEIPYGVYTNTICEQLEKIIESEDNPGIDRFNDLTGEKPLIKIYLLKKATPDKVLKYLYKETSLQSYFGINFTMLDNGRFPKVFTWKEMLQAHIDHEKVVYRRGFEYDYNKIIARIHIIEGLLKAYDMIDDVIHTIKASASSATAATALCKLLEIDDVQAKAILDLKLAKLSNLDITKLINEKGQLEKNAEEINRILTNEELFNNELVKGWREVADKFGDARRTKVLQLSEGENNEPIEQKQLSLAFTNQGAVYVSEVSSLYTQKRNGTGNKFKLLDGEYIIDNICGKNTDTILFFTNKGNFYHMKMGDFSIGEKQYVSNFVNLGVDEVIVTATTTEGKEKYIVFITKNGIIKKSELIEYNMKRNVGAVALNLDKDDEIVSALLMDEENIGILSKSGNFIRIKTDDIRAIGRTAKGVCGMKLNDGDCVVSARPIKKDVTEIISVATDGNIKRSSIDEFRITGRATKGSKIQKADEMADFLPINTKDDILIVSSKAQIRLRLNDIPLLSRGAQGVKSIKLAENSKILKLGEM